MRRPDDRSALELLAGSVGRMRTEDVTVARVRNTLELSRMWVTQNLLEGQNLASGEPFELTFDAAGNLPDFERNR